MVVNNVHGVVAIRKGPWKYIEGVPAREGAKKGKPELYNLETDISETKNCIEDQPEVYEDLKNTLDEIRKLGSERLSISSK